MSRAVRIELNEAIKHIQAARFELLKVDGGLEFSERIKNLETSLAEELNLFEANIGIVIKWPGGAVMQ
jgi:hypothetical protein